MEDETSRLLKLFDAAVTDFEAEMHKLEAIAGRLDADSDKEKLARLLKGASESCVDVNTRWLEVTERVFRLQHRLQHCCADAAAKACLTTEMEATRMEAGE